jgi:hypothetical protein
VRIGVLLDETNDKHIKINEIISDSDDGNKTE